LGVLWKRTTAKAINIVLTVGTAFCLAIGILYLWVIPSDKWPHFLLLSFYLSIVLSVMTYLVSVFDKKGALQLQTAAYLINRLPTPGLNMRSPHTVLFKFSPNYTKLKTFGCLCFPWLKPYTSNKLQPRSEPCIFLGYSLTQSALYVIILKPARYITHVMFSLWKQFFPIQLLTNPSYHQTSMTPQLILSLIHMLNHIITKIPPKMLHLLKLIHL
jgi:hypothetical protein